MKIPYKVHFKDINGDLTPMFPPLEVIEYTIMPSGKIVVMTESKPGYPESLWFYNDGNNPKSHLEFKTL